MSEYISSSGTRIDADLVERVVAATLDWCWSQIYEWRDGATLEKIRTWVHKPWYWVYNEGCLRELSRSEAYELAMLLLVEAPENQEVRLVAEFLKRGAVRGPEPYW